MPERPLVSSTASPGPADRIAHAIAVWFGCGLVPYAPGTAGTIGAIPLYLVLRPHGLTYVALAAVIISAVGVWASGRVAARLGAEDPQIVCVDEVAGVLITWLGAPEGWVGLIVGFVVFRLLDQFKPWPARLAERRMPPAWGIMFDDIFAGAWGALIMFAAQRLGWLG